jgi:hypothetical protein
MGAAKGVEARAHPRARARIKVEFHYGSTTGVGHTMDISEGGIFLNCKRIAQTGTRIYLRLHLPGSQAGEPLKVIGLVTRAVQPKSVGGGEDDGGGMGIHFEVAYARTREALGEFIEALLSNAGARGDIELVAGATTKRPEYSVRLGNVNVPPVAVGAPAPKPLTAAQVDKAFSFGTGGVGIQWGRVARATLIVLAMLAALGLVGWGVSCISGLMHTNIGGG